MLIPTLFPIAYAEMHYRFRYFFSFLKKRHPEIIIDAPYRVVTGQTFPVVLIIKDAHRYPATLKHITLYFNDQIVLDKNMNQPLIMPYQDFIFSLPCTIESGLLQIQAKIEYKIGRKTFICFNHNYRSRSHSALQVEVARQSFPTFEHFVHGDLHSHSNYTNDQIEFGASVETTAAIARSLGLRFLAITDHSYDLDDQQNNYLQNDPSLGKWQAFKEEVDRFNNTHPDFCILPGEEVSVRNHHQKNIHLLILNDSNFYPGSGDSGEKWLHFYSEYTLKEIIDRLQAEALAVAAHPAERPPYLHRKLLNRSEWQMEDLQSQKIYFFQFLNGYSEQETERSIEQWKILLLRGQRAYILAGNDSHGNFARNIHIKLPFLSIEEDRSHLLGLWRTVLYLPATDPTPHTIIRAIKSGNCFMTNGPAIRLNLTSGDSLVSMGALVLKANSYQIHVLSSIDFGTIQRVTLFKGQLDIARETVLFEMQPRESLYSFSKVEKLVNGRENYYLRAEVITRKEGLLFRAITNPIWILEGNNDS